MILLSSYIVHGTWNKIEKRREEKTRKWKKRRRIFPGGYSRIISHVSFELLISLHTLLSSSTTSNLKEWEEKQKGNGSINSGRRNKPRKTVILYDNIHTVDWVDMIQKLIIKVNYRLILKTWSKFKVHLRDRRMAKPNFDSSDYNSAQLQLGF